MTGEQSDRLIGLAIGALTLIALVGIVGGIIVAYLGQPIGAVVAVVTGAVGGIVAIMLQTRRNGSDDR